MTGRAGSARRTRGTAWRRPRRARRVMCRSRPALWRAVGRPSACGDAFREGGGWLGGGDVAVSQRQGAVRSSCAVTMLRPAPWCAAALMRGGASSVVHAGTARISGRRDQSPTRTCARYRTTVVCETSSERGRSQGESRQRKSPVWGTEPSPAFTDDSPGTLSVHPSSTVRPETYGVSSTSSPSAAFGYLAQILLSWSWM